MIRTMIVDDEPHARADIRVLLEREPQFELVGECVDGVDALERIRDLSPALLFLDIQMPGLTGLQLLDVIPTDRVPYLIFTTAYHQYAAQAFDMDAVDYLLKPFDEARFRRALEKVKLKLSEGLSPDIHRLQSDLERFTVLLKSGQQTQPFTVRVGTRIRFMDPKKIRYIKAEGNYVRIVGDEESVLARERIADMEKQLQDAGFLRIHRSVLINLSCTKEMRPHEYGEYEFVLENGESFVSSAAYRERIRAIVVVTQRGRQ